MESQDVAQYLKEHADFFELHPELLGQLAVPHPQNGQAISLVERQSLVLRDRIRALETRLAELIRNGEDNDAVADRLVKWGAALLRQGEADELPRLMLAELKRLFDVPLAAVRVWGVRPEFAALDAAQPVGADVLRLAAGMQAPFCGSNMGFEVARWLTADDSGVASLAILPLRLATDQETYGLLVLGSPDRDRFQITMGTSFLARIGALASAAMARLRP